MSKIKSLIIIILLYSLYVPITAQNKYDFEQFGEETGDFFTAPSNWDRNNFITLGIITAATYGLMFTDQPIKNEMAKINSNKTHGLMEIGR